jgi:hypothetical protein
VTVDDPFLSWRGMVRDGRYLMLWNKALAARPIFPEALGVANELVFTWLQFVPCQADGEANAVGAGLAGASIVTSQVDERSRCAARFGCLRPRPARRAPLAGV